MATNSSDIPSNAIQSSDESSLASASGERKKNTNKINNACPELIAFRTLFERLAGVDQEDFTWTWDHENYVFLIQARNNVIDQYVSILKRELGEALCLHLDRASIIVDLRPWKTNPDKTSLRIGFEGSHIPIELQGFTGLEDLINLHLVPTSNDSPEIKKVMNNFRLTCSRIDNLLDRKSEWMWERHWRADGLAFAVVRAYTWMNKYLLVERELELFNNSPSTKETGLHIELSTYNRGTSFNVRIAVDGLPDNLRTDIRILDVFDTHFFGMTR